MFLPLHISNCSLIVVLSPAEVNDLLDSATKDERGASGRTRGVKNDAFKQEREMDQALADTGITDAEQSVEIGRATGPTS